MSTPEASAGYPKITKNKKIPSVLTWNDPVRSGSVFGYILAILFVTRYFNLLRLALRLSYWAIGATALLEFVTRHLKGGKNGVVSSYRPSRYITVSRHTVEKYTTRLINLSSDVAHEGKKVLDAEDLSVSAIAFVVVLAAYLLTGCVSLSTLAFIATIGAFTIPRLYLQFEKEIDEVAAQIHKEATTQYEKAADQVKKAAGPHIEKARTQVCGVASSLGYNLNRGGFPSNEKKPETASSSSGVAEATETKSSAPVNIATSVEARTIDGVTYDSVPTLIGNVNLAGEAKKAEDAVPPSVTTGQTIEDLASELKTDIENEPQLHQ
ncbi:hypothetical protein TRVA0_044S00122 [Trichomonascus vanleenenianus]|uniref:Rtn1p n=1 Tax=Trichomonascus vanleenenianus TaxID=2268995 RepID=UPI003EC9F915